MATDVGEHVGDILAAEKYYMWHCGGDFFPSHFVHSPQFLRTWCIEEKIISTDADIISENFMSRACQE